VSYDRLAPSNFPLPTNAPTGSIKDAAASVAKGLIAYYDGDQPGKIPGILPGPPPSGDYYWGESGQMWNTLIAYAHAMGDSSYNDLIAKGLLWQTGPGDNFMPANWSTALGNDDQGMWAMAAMTAAETNFTTGQSNNWLRLAQNVFDNMASPSRWNETGGEDSCGGGLRWQVFTFNAGYDYKNSISTGMLFNLASRLARLTGNATYAEWADKTWTWMEDVGFLTPSGAIYDGAHVATNCTDINKMQFSYNLGVFIEGAAHMYNSTSGGDVWRDRLGTLVNGTSYFTDDNCVPVEPACEGTGRCTTDMLMFKSVLLRGLSATAEFAPHTVGRVGCVLDAAANATAAACGGEGDDKGAQCGFVWTEGKDDGLHGAGQQMNALAALTGEYRLRVAPPDGGAAGGNGSATGGGTGGGGSGSPTQSGAAPTSSKNGAGMTADRAGAGILLAAAVLAVGFTALLA